MSTLHAHQTDRFEQAIGVRNLLNKGLSAFDALTAMRINPDDVFGEDIGDECLDVDDPQNDVIDLGWTGDEANPEAPATHYQIRRTSNRSPWAVEVMQRFEEETP